MSDAKKYGAEGGRKRAENLSKAELSAAARTAALIRWSGSLPRAVVGGGENALVIGGVEMPAYVLEDGRRVLAQRGLQGGIGMSTGGGTGGARRIASLMHALQRKGIDTKDLALRSNSPIRFIQPQGGLADGYEATILPDICAVLIEADQRGLLQKQQKKLAHQAARLQHGFATLGIIALVDKATGYEEYMRQQGVTEILEKFISKELRPWAKRFPFEFYEGIFKLRGWDTSDLTPNSPKPIEVGKVTDDLIYKRLAPAVRGELKRLTPRNEKGYLVSKLHQRLSGEIGDPKLEKHIARVVTLMQSVLLDYPDGDGWPVFMHKMNKLIPIPEANYELPLADAPRALPRRNED